DGRHRVHAASGGRHAPGRPVYLPRRRTALGDQRETRDEGRGGRGRRAHPARRARRAARAGVRPPRWAGTHALPYVAAARALRAPPAGPRAVTFAGTAVALVGAAVAGAAALRSGLLALGEGAAVGEAAHTLVD